MATNQTTNYQLNQWQPTDAVQRVDFNADNAKVDAALAGHTQLLAQTLRRCQRIKTVPFQEIMSRQIYFDLSDLDWNEWEYVFFSFDTGTGCSTPDVSHDELYIYLDGGASAQYSSYGNNRFAQSRLNPFLLVLFPYHDENSRAQGICVGSVSSYGFGGGTFSDLTSIRVLLALSDRYFPNTIEMKLWGIK